MHQENRIATSGRWLIAAVLAAKGFATLYAIVVDFSRAWHDPGTLTYPTDYVAVALCVLYLASAWGIVKWRKWAHISAITLSFSDLAVLALALALDWSAALNRNVALWVAINCAAIAWLVLPSVRSRYQQKLRTA